MARPRKYSPENFRLELQALCKKYSIMGQHTLDYEIGAHFYMDGYLSDFFQGYEAEMAAYIGESISKEAQEEKPKKKTMGRPRKVGRPPKKKADKKK